MDRGDALYLYLLLVRFNLITLVALSFLAATYFQGWLDTIIKAELAKLSGVIALYSYLGLPGAPSACDTLQTR